MMSTNVSFQQDGGLLHQFSQDHNVVIVGTGTSIRMLESADAEQREVGSISRQVYASYLQAYGGNLYLIPLTILSCTLVERGLQVLHCSMYLQSIVLPSCAYCLVSG